MDLREVPDTPFERHPWELARWKFFFRVLQESRALDRPSDILDVGSGDAFFSHSLIQAAEQELRVTCWDSAYDDANRHLLPGDAGGRLGYCTEQPQRRFDLILLLDILEHVEDDVLFLRDIVDKNVSPGGELLISVPARMILFSRHDRYLRHYRRYGKNELHAVVEQAGLELVRGGGLFHSLVPVRLAQKAREAVADKLFGNGEDTDAQEDYKGLGNWRWGPGLSGLLTKALSLDAWTSLQLSRVGLDFWGLSWWCICRKTAS